ncbi:hypothetical protein SS50377_23013 [Spironucleus salmonicida]|uniref:Uncharacterized protein n=1 Tax=Spironucleus salmonicida TaxID=348837 RepID=V6M2V1_9EUKA|nr:hypothetical protein SS50377_23013 [Spironucleus salmonicida]|eukprot:EST47594.1 hypothetical protein SS50377_12286 [Spironucleus salmonicida]
MDQNLTFSIESEQQQHKQEYNIGDLTIETQREVKSLIQLIKTQYTSQIKTSFTELSDNIKNRQFYVMFEPKLNTNALSDHQIPRSILPILEPFIKDAQDQTRIALDNLLTDTIVSAFGKTYESEIDVKYKQQLKIDALEVDLRRYNTQSDVQQRIIDQLQSQLVSERQKFVKEFQAIKEQVFQKNRVGGKYVPDFNENPQSAQELLQLPDIPNLDSIRSRSAKEPRVDATKLKILSQQCAVMQKQLGEGEKIRVELKETTKRLKIAEADLANERLTMREELTQYKNRLAELEKHNMLVEEQYNDSQIYLERKQESIDQLKTQIKDFDNLEKQYQLVAQEYNKLKIKSDKTTRELEKLKIEFDANLQEGEQSQSVAIVEKENQLNELNQKLNQLIKSNEDLEDQNEQLIQEVQQLKVSQKSQDLSNVTDSMMEVSQSQPQEKQRKKRKITVEFKQQFPEVQLQTSTTKSNLYDSGVQGHGNSSAIQNSNIRDVIAFRTEFDSGKQVLGFNWSVDDVDDVMKKVLGDIIDFRSQLRGRNIKRVQQTQFLKEMFGKDVQEQFLQEYRQESILANSNINKDASLNSNNKSGGKSLYSQSDVSLQEDDDLQKIQEELNKNLNQNIIKPSNVLHPGIDQNISINSQNNLHKSGNNARPPIPLVNQKNYQTTSQKIIATDSSIDQDSSILRNNAQNNQISSCPKFETLKDASIITNNTVPNSTKEDIQEINLEILQQAPNFPTKESQYINYKPGITGNQSDKMLNNNSKNNNQKQTSNQSKNINTSKPSQNKVNMKPNVSFDKKPLGPSSVTSLTKEKQNNQMITNNFVLPDEKNDSISQNQDKTESVKDIMEVQAYIPISQNQHTSVNNNQMINNQLNSSIDYKKQNSNADSPYTEIENHQQDNAVNSQLTSISIDPRSIIEEHIEDQVNESLALQIKAVASNHSIISFVNYNDDVQSDQVTESDIDDEEFIRLIEHDSFKDEDNLVISNDKILNNQNIISYQEQNPLLQSQYEAETISNNQKDISNLIQIKQDVKAPQKVNVKEQLIEILGGQPQPKNIQLSEKQLQIATEEEKKKIIVTALKDQLFTFLLNNDIENETQETDQTLNNHIKSLQLVDELQYILTDKFTSEKVLQDYPLDQKDMDSIAKQLYKATTLKKVVNMLPQLDEHNKQIVQQLFDPNTCQQFQDNNLDEKTHPLIKQIFFNSNLLPLLVQNKEKVTLFQNENLDQSQIEEALLLTVQNDLYTPEKMASNLQSCLENYKFENAHSQLMQKLKNIFADDFYEEILKGNENFTEEARLSLIQILQDATVVQKFLQSDIDKNTAKKLFLLYEPGRVRRLQQNQISSEEVKRIIDILLDPEVIRILFGNNISDIELKKLVQQRSEAKQVEKQIKTSDHILLNTDIAKKMSHGMLDKATLNAVVKTFYSKNVSNLIASSKFSTETAKQISTVLYNPEFMKQLQNDEADESNIQRLAQVIYNPEVIQLLQSNIKSKQVREQARQCAAIVQTETQDVLSDSKYQIPFQVISSVNDIKENLSNSKSRHQMSQIQASQNVSQGYQRKGYKSGGSFRRDSTVKMPFLQGNNKQAPSFIRSFKLPGEEDISVSQPKTKKSPQKNVQQKINSIRYNSNNNRQESPPRHVVPCCIVGLSGVEEPIYKSEITQNKPVYKNLHDKIRREYAEREIVISKQQERPKPQEKLSLLTQVPLNNEGYIADRREQAKLESFKNIVNSVGLDNENPGLDGFTFKKL